MFSFGYVIFIIIVVVVFVIRAVAQAGKKHEEPPPIPVHFEDDIEEPSAVRDTVHKSAPVKPPAVSAAKMGQYRPLPQLSLSPNVTTAARAAPAPKVSPAYGSPVGAGAASTGQKGIALNLNHLSPMKQAVVMAEILGTPKGLL